MRIDEVRVFVSVLEAGSFVAAARQMGMPTSTISGKIAALEQRLGVTLIQRTTRKLRPTPAGQKYFDRCRKALAEIALAEAELATDSSDVPSGTLRLTAPTALARVILPPLITGFRREFPAVRLEISVTDEKLDLVKDGVDLALRVGPLQDSSLIARLLVDGSGGLFASADYLKRHGVPATIEQLTGHQFVGRANGQTKRAAEGDILGTLNLGAAVVCDDFNLARELIAMGAGIGYLPIELAAGHGDHKPLVQVIPNYAPAPVGLYLVYPQQSHVPARVRCFITFAVEASKTLRL